jgi:hypothetical protein
MMTTPRETAFWLASAVFVALQIWQHVSASFALPIPWPDESHFLWPAVAFAETGDLFAPQIHADRAVFWMPPGFMIAEAMWLKTFGLSLGVARGFSFVMLVLAFLTLAAILRKHRLPVLSLILAGVVFLNGPFVACGNNARPEAMLLLFVLGGFLLMGAGHRGKGLAVVAVTPLIHPNGVYFAGSAVLYLTFTRGRPAGSRKMSRLDRAALAIAATLWLGYLVYVGSNWEHFLHDMAFQLEHKSGRDISGRLLDASGLVTLAVVALGCRYLARHGIRWGVLVAVGLPAWLAYRIGLEMWYDVFRNLAAICFSLIVLHAAHHAAFARSPGERAVLRWPLFLLVLASVGYWNFRIHTIQPLRAYPDRMAWHGLGFPDDVPYFTDEDRETVTGVIESARRDHDVKVIQFLPRADAFLLPGIVADRDLLVSHRHPLLCERKPDLYIIHRSRYRPRKWGDYEGEDLEAIFEVDDVAQLSRAQVEAIRPFLSRDGTELWFRLVPGSVAGDAVPRGDDGEGED